jgi:hypothetical protein
MHMWELNNSHYKLWPIAKTVAIVMLWQAVRRVFGQSSTVTGLAIMLKICTNIFPLPRHKTVKDFRASEKKQSEIRPADQNNIVFPTLHCTIIN